VDYGIGGLAYVLKSLDKDFEDVRFSANLDWFCPAGECSRSARNSAERRQVRRIRRALFSAIGRSSIGVSVQWRVMSMAIMDRSNAITLVRRDVEPLKLDSLPANIEFIPGQMIVSFRTIEDLAQAVYSLARAIETDERLEFRDLSVTKQLSSPYSGI
jgi:hypothetical protein